MTLPTVNSYPWHALEPVDRATSRALGELLPWFDSPLSAARFASALSQLLSCSAEIIVTDTRARTSPTECASVWVDLEHVGVVCLELDDNWVVWALGRLLERPITLSRPGLLDDTLRGALAALVTEVARRAGNAPPRVLAEPPDVAGRLGLMVRASLVLDDRPYAATATLWPSQRPRRAEPDPRSLLRRLGSVPIRIPVVAGLSLADRDQLDRLTVGDAWLPGAGFWLESDLSGPAVLAGPTAESGARVRLAADGSAVLSGEQIATAHDTESSMQRDESEPDDLVQDAALQAPIVVRIEVGSVAMTARDWAELKPGDVIEAGTRVADPVVLRVAGQVVAEGELVSVEGELGVRIRKLRT